MTTQVDVPKTMKVWVAFGTGKFSDILELKTDWPTPGPPRTGEIMIRISYVAINPGDPKMLTKPIPFRRTAVAGMDFVGEVIQVGPISPDAIAGIRVGMIVAGTVPMVSILRGVGSLAEYLVVPTHAVVEKPNGLDESVAAGLLGIVGQTSVVLLRAAKLHGGDSVLVNGASGGVGSVLIQMLRGMGVHVTGICSAGNEALVRRLGAEEVVDYTAHENLYDHLCFLVTSKEHRHFDAIIDLVGDDTMYYRSPGYLKVDGKFHSIAQGPLGFLTEFKLNHWPVMLGGIPRSYSAVFSNPAGSSAQEVVEWFNKGCIKETPIDSIFDFKDVPQASCFPSESDSSTFYNDFKKAFERLGTQRTVGKILIKVKE